MDIREIKFTRNKTVIYDWKNGKIIIENGKTSRITKWKAIYELQEKHQRKKKRDNVNYSSIY